MYKLCLSCYEVERPIVGITGDFCSNCYNEKILMVDELLVPVIITLHKKGYIILNSCSSYIWKYRLLSPANKETRSSDEVYITFGLPRSEIPLPDGFYYVPCGKCNFTECNCNTVQIREYNPRTKGKKLTTEKVDYLTRQKEVFNVINTLLEWSINLPERNQ